MYHPESYWDEVAQRIDDRGESNIIAGDDEPFYRYKREKFLRMLRTIDFSGKKILEVGSGPGGNLYEISSHQPGELHGVDISENMVRVASKNLQNKGATITKIDGTHIPYPDRYFDIIITSTVLQHNTDEAMLKQLIAEICRVGGGEVNLFERIEKSIKGDELNLGRPVSYYASLFEAHGFKLKEVKFLNINCSYYVSGAIRKLFNSTRRKEGEPVSKLSYFLQWVSLPVTKVLDNVFKAERDLGHLRFIR